jgi:threonine/homoserine/homoserine lactone efflux protein
VILDAQLFVSFLIAAAVVNLTPGPAMLYVMSFGVSQGRIAGLSAAAGIAAGSVTHVILAVVGVSVLISSSPVILTALKLVGIAYLVHLGVAALRDKSHLSATPEKPFRANGKIAGRAMLVNLLNPKVIVFYIAFLPQFIDPDGSPVYLQMLFLGVVFVIIGFSTDATVGLVSGSLSRGLARKPKAAGWLNMFCGVVMFVLAAVLAADFVV